MTASTASDLHTAPRRSLKRDMRGVTALEYALIASLVGLSIVGGMSSFGLKLSAHFQKVGTTISQLRATT